MASKEAESLLKKLRRLESNLTCVNCATPAPQGIGFGNVCVKFKTFVCDCCKTSHQAISHRVKSITMSNWTLEEVLELTDQKGGGNAAARYIWLQSAPNAGCKYSGGTRPKQGDNIEIFKRFVIDCYERGLFRSQSNYVPSVESDMKISKPLKPLAKVENSTKITKPTSSTSTPISPPVNLLEMDAGFESTPTTSSTSFDPFMSANATKVNEASFATFDAFKDSSILPIVNPSSIDPFGMHALPVPPTISKSSTFPSTPPMPASINLLEFDNMSISQSSNKSSTNAMQDLLSLSVTPTANSFHSGNSVTSSVSNQSPVVAPVDIFGATSDILLPNPAPMATTSTSMVQDNKLQNILMVNESMKNSANTYNTPMNGYNGMNHTSFTNAPFVNRSGMSPGLQPYNMTMAPQSQMRGITPGHNISRDMNLNGNQNGASRSYPNLGSVAPNQPNNFYANANSNSNPSSMASFEFIQDDMKKHLQYSNK